jgi:hypothetical protein
MRLIKDFLICFVTGVAIAWLFFVYGLDLHLQSKEKPPWSKPAAVEMTHGR